MANHERVEQPGARTVLAAEGVREHEVPGGVGVDVASRARAGKRLAAGTPLQLGATVWSDSGGGVAELVLFQQGSAGQMLRRDGVPVMPGLAPRRFTSPRLTVAAGATQVRVQLYLTSSDTFRVDDVWLSVVP